MEINKKPVQLKTNEIIEIAYDTACRCYGVVGVCQKDINKITTLTKENAKKGIIVRKFVDNTFSVEVYLILSNDVKISEAIRETQKAIRYILNKKSGIMCKNVDVYALGVN
jgi:uncharacterized alkaline shock family protein YloU